MKRAPRLKEKIQVRHFKLTEVDDVTYSRTVWNVGFWSVDQRYAND